MFTNLKKELLKDSDNGLLFFKIYFGKELHQITPTRFKNVKNPFYDDKKGSLSIYHKKGKWWYKDHGNSDYRGDCFDFYKLVFNDVKGFNDLLKAMKETLEKGLSKVTENSQNKFIEPESKISRIELQKIPLEYKALKFWREYGITEEILKINNVNQINGYTIIYSSGDREFTSQPDMVFAYEMGNYSKIYYPKTNFRNKKFFAYRGNKGKQEYVFGLNFQTESNIIFIVGGEKDVMTMHSLGYQAFCLGSENIQPSKRLLKELYYDGLKVIILYDNDDTGKKEARRLSSMNSWEIADISTIVNEDVGKRVKDVSDYIKVGLPIERLKIFLNQFEECKSQVIEETEVNKLSERLNLDSIQEQEHPHHTYISEFVYENLPESLKSVVSKFNHKRRDLVLMGSLGVLSNIIKVTGIYDHKVVYPNLFVFITAPASAGKGDLVWTKKLGEAINKKFDQDYNDAYKAYLNDKKNIQKPNKKRLFISGNASYSALLQQLFINNGEGIMFETEADTLNTALEKEWGNYSDIMRRVFEFEAVSRLRKDEEESIDIEKPRLSIVLTGTKDQLVKLVPTPENGLFSRFIFMDLPQTVGWRNPFESSEDYSVYFSKLADVFLQYYSGTRSENISFSFSSLQIPIFNELHAEKEEHDNVILGSEIIPSVRRMGAIHFRLAMLLSTIRMLDDGKFLNNITCNDIDFKVSTVLVKFFAQHTTKIYNQLPKKTKEYVELKKEIVIFLEGLNDEFTSKDIINLGEQMQIAKSTYEAYIRKLIKIKYVERYKQGLYRKIRQSD